MGDFEDYMIWDLCFEVIALSSINEHEAQCSASIQLQREPSICSSCGRGGWYNNACQIPVCQQCHQPITSQPHQCQILPRFRQSMLAEPVEPICGLCGAIAPTIGHSWYSDDALWYATIKAPITIEKKAPEEEMCPICAELFDIEELPDHMYWHELESVPAAELLKCAAGNHSFPHHEKFSGNCACICCNNCVLIHYMEGHDNWKAWQNAFGAMELDILATIHKTSDYASIPREKPQQIVPVQPQPSVNPYPAQQPVSQLLYTYADLPYLICQEINSIRTKPYLYASVLQDWLSHCDGKTVRMPGQLPRKYKEGASVLQESLQFLSMGMSLAPLEFSQELSYGALDLARSFDDDFNIIGPPFDQICSKYGSYQVSLSMFTRSGLVSPPDFVLQLMINDGDQSRSQRQMMLGDSKRCRTLGIAVVPHDKFDNIVVICYSGGMRPKQRYNRPPIPQGGISQSDFAPMDIPPQVTESGLSYYEFTRLVFDEVNLVRTDPAGTVAYLERNLALFRGNLLWFPDGHNFVTHEGPVAVLECIEVLRHTQPMPALKWNWEWAAAAQDHCNDIGPLGITGHQGSDGNYHSKRIERHGVWKITSGENIYFGWNEAKDSVMALIVDDNVPDRGHRDAILNRDYILAGVGAGPHGHYKHMHCMNFATAIKRTSQFTPVPKTPQGLWLA